MKKILWAFGDSFSEGYIKYPAENTPTEREEICYPNQIVERSQLFDICNNLSEKGSNNEMILYQVQKNIDNFHQQDFVLITLTHCLRAAKYNFAMDEYLKVTSEIEHDYAKRHPVWQTDMMLCWITKELRERNIRYMIVSGFEPYSVYSKISYSQLRDLCFINPEFMNNTLFDILLGDYCTKQSAKLDLLEIDPRSTRISPRTWDYSGNKYITECNHPSAAGHILIADTLIPCLKEYL